MSDKSISKQNYQTNPQLNTQLPSTGNASSNHNLYPGYNGFNSICTTLSHLNVTNIDNTNSSENDIDANTSLSLLNNSFNQSH